MEKSWWYKKQSPHVEESGIYQLEEWRGESPLRYEIMNQLVSRMNELLDNWSKLHLRQIYECSLILLAWMPLQWTVTIFSLILFDVILVYSCSTLRWYHLFRNYNNVIIIWKRPLRILEISVQYYQIINYF